MRCDAVRVVAPRATGAQLDQRLLSLSLALGETLLLTCLTAPVTAVSIYWESRLFQKRNCDATLEAGLCDLCLSLSPNE